MKDRYFLSFRRLYQLSAFSILAISFIVISGCSEPKSDSVDWLNLKITFKENTTEAIRQASLNAIEKSILDTIGKLQNTYKDFNPSISRIRISVRDSLHYAIIVASPFQATAPPLCTCQNGCKICRIVNDIHVMPVSTPEFAIGDFIDTVDTEPVKVKGDPVNK